MLEIIVASIFIATFLNLLLKKIKIPIIIGYITTGTIIAYMYGLHSAANSHELKIIAEFGVVFLMFTIGLEFSVRHLIKMKKEVFVFGALQVTITASIISLCAAYIFDFDSKSAIIIGAGLALSSTAIVLKLLNESGDINKEYGRKTLGILLFQDLAVIPIFLMITIFSIKDTSTTSLLFEILIGGVLLFLALWIIGKYLLEPFLYHVSKTNSNEIFVGSVLLLVFGASYLAHTLGFSYSLGAFAAGMMIAETHYKHQVEADLIPFRDLLLGLFFITVGMQIDFHLIQNYLLAITLLLFALILLKVGIIYVILIFSTVKRVALKSAITLFQLGEFGLVVFELANVNSLIDSTISQILIVTIVISMVLTPLILRNISSIVDKFFSNTDTKSSSEHLECMQSNHVVLIGYGRLGKNIANLLEKQNMDYIAIEQNIEEVKKAQKQGKPVIYGNASQKNILTAMHIQSASTVIISLGNSEKMYLICSAVNSLTSSAKIIVKVNMHEEKKVLSDLNLSHIIVETEETARSMFEEIKSV